MADTPAQRKRRQRLRAVGLLPPLGAITCQSCGAPATGLYDPRCSHCWERETPEGLAAVAARVAAWRARQRRQRQRES